MIRISDFGNESYKHETIWKKLLIAILGNMIRKNFFRYDTDGGDFGKRQFPEAGSGGSRDGDVVQDVCGMCGRTILTGEKTELFSAQDKGRPVKVCSQCRTAARDAGLSSADDNR